MTPSVGAEVTATAIEPGSRKTDWVTDRVARTEEGALDNAVERSPAPAAVRVAIDRLEAAHPGLRGRLADEPRLCRAVTAVTAGSRSLTLLLETDPAALQVLADLDYRPLLAADVDAPGLRRWKQLELLRIAARDLLAIDDLDAIGSALAELASDVLQAACRLAGAEGLAVIGMGKLGGRELNYASDIDVMFACAPDLDLDTGEPAAREVMRIARSCFRVDANLRPEGRDGRLVRTVSSYEAYWERWAQPWEFQAILKARAVAGDGEVGAAFDEAASGHLWSHSFNADDIRSLRSMKARSEQEVARRRLTERDLKQAAGGIRDIEFAVQLLQLVHGRHDLALRNPTTLRVLGEMGDAGYVDGGDAQTLAIAYRFLRGAEHRLQLVDEQQVHTLPADRTARDRLARTMGFRDSAGAAAVDQFDAHLRGLRAAVRSIHERLYFRPLLEAFAGTDSRLSSEATEARLAAFGFRDADRTRQAVAELTKGLTRSSRLMRQLLPLLLGWLADAPDPDLGLLGLRTLATGGQRSQELAQAFRESAETARRLCTVIATSRLLGTILERNPDLIADLGDPAAMLTRSRAELRDRMETKIALRDPEAHHRILKRSKEREFLRVAARDVLDLVDVEATGRDLTALAEATLDASLEAVRPTMPFAVVAMGRFGGAELSYASDLDVLFVYEGDSPKDFEAAEEVAIALMRYVKGATPADRIYLMDADLRPEGRQGPLARSLEGYRTYFARWAQPWERLAMTRARAVAGDGALGQQFLDTVRPFVWETELSADEVREIRRVKARVEKERIPAGEDPQFHLKLGRGSLSDIEFCAQLLQRKHHVTAAGTIDALGSLHETGALDAADLVVLSDAYRFCERTRNRWFLIKGGPGDSLPSQPEQLSRLARSLDTTPVELREEYRRVTRRSRAVVERLFYGREAPAGTGHR